jgi:hypothetical protein
MTQRSFSPAETNEGSIGWSRYRWPVVIRSARPPKPDNFPATPKTGWLRVVPPEFRRYSFRRIFFAIGTNPDVPLVQVTAAAAVCWIAEEGVRRKASPFG